MLVNLCSSSMERAARNNKMKDLINNKRFFFVVILVCGYIFVVNNAVFMQHDDYGYGCLCYGYTGNIHGMSWTLVDLIKFLYWQYKNWGGRILFFGFETIALRISPSFIKVFQSLIITIIVYNIYSTEKEHKYDLLTLILVVLSFFSIGIFAMIDGVYWYTASAIYLWPFLFFTLAIRLEQKANLMEKLATGICLFIAGFSQEQIAVAVIVYSVCSTAQKYVKFKHFEIKYLAGIIGGLCCLLAPGNFVRADSNNDFYELSITKKFCLNIPKIIYANLNYSNGARVAIYVAVLVLFCFYYKEKKVIVINTVGIISLLVTSISGKDSRIIWAGLLFLLIFIIEFSICLIQNCHINYLFLLVAALATQGMMVFSPVIAYRTTIPFAMITTILLTCILKKLLPVVSIPLRLLSIMIMLILTFMEMIYITRGLYQNYDENVSNQAILKSAQQSVKAGESINTVILKRLKNDNFVNAMPYIEGYEYINYWIKGYYEIPQEVELIWK